MAAKSNLPNMVICLTAVCLVCAALLGVVYVVTEQPIKDAATKELQQALSQVLPQNGEINPEACYADFDGTKYEYYVQKVDSTSNIAVKSVVNGFGGPLTLLVGIESNGIVHATKVLSHSETPGLGAKCQTDVPFISQFEGFNPSEKKLAVKKDGGDVDAITASTITSRAYTKAVDNAVKFVSDLQKKQEVTNE